MAKPGIPQGTRDFSAEIIRKRNFILNTIRTVFELFGFEPLETPALENLSTLLGKYGGVEDWAVWVRASHRRKGDLRRCLSVT